MIIIEDVPEWLRENPLAVVKYLSALKENVNDREKRLFEKVIVLYKRVIDSDLPTFDEWFNIQWEALAEVPVIKVAKFAEHGLCNFSK